MMEELLALAAAITQAAEQEAARVASSSAGLEITKEKAIEMLQARKEQHSEGSGAF